jgi:puromycin-sensitive aminopeptidase
MSTIRIAFVLLVSACAIAQRLPDVAVPEHYQLSLAPDLQKKTFQGDETIRIRVLTPTPTITLNAAELTFQQATIKQGDLVQTANVATDTKQETATLAVQKPLTPGEASLHIVYSGILNDQMRGFYLSRSDKRNYAVTQFEATDPRRAFPSFDEPDKKTIFEVTAIVDQGDIAISNGRVLSDTPGPATGKHTIKFAASPKMSSYLVALAVGDFECEEGAADGIPIRICGTPDKKGMGQFALKAAEFTLHYYNQYFGIKYPYGKLDIIGMPDFSAGAMENVGCIISRDLILFVDPKSSSYFLQKAVAQAAVAHEMAHQWFGDLVTTKWWDDLWLNEGFATWMSFKPIQAYRPDWNMQSDAAQSADQAMDEDSLNSTHPIHQDVKSPQEILELADSITYNKAAATLSMVEGYVTPEVFRKAVDAYLTKYSYSNATSEDFWNTIAQASNKPVDKIMAGFVKQPGVPLVSSKASCMAGKTTITLTQQRYFYDRKLLEAGSPEQWQIPVCLKTGQKESCQVLAGKSAEMTLPGCDPVYLNAGARGYYRSSYDPANLHALAQIAEHGLSPEERVRLVDDSWAGLRVGKLNAKDYMLLAESLKDDPSRAVGDEITGQLQYAGDYLVNDDDRAAYQAWLRNTFEPVGDKLGWTSSPDDSEERRAQRANLFTLVGDAGRDPKLVPLSRELVQKALRGEAVDATLLYPATRIVARNGDTELYNTLLERLKATQSPEEYFRWLRMLGQFQNPALVQRSLEYAISDQVRSQDAPFLLGALMREATTRKTAWAFIREHWPQVEAKLTNFSTGTVINNAARFCDTADRDEVQQFFSQHPIPGTDRTLRQSLETINNCIDLHQQQESNLRSWLREQTANASSTGGRQ